MWIPRNQHNQPASKTVSKLKSKQHFRKGGNLQTCSQLPTQNVGQSIQGHVISFCPSYTEEREREMGHCYGNARKQVWEELEEKISFWSQNVLRSSDKDAWAWYWCQYDKDSLLRRWRRGRRSMRDDIKNYGKSSIFINLSNSPFMLKI